ncbi:flippase [Candidatus Omnitrophota bacterium]
MLKTIIKNFSALMLSQIIYKLLSFIIIVYVAKHIGSAGFGQFSFILCLGLLFLGLADMGLSELYISEVAGNIHKERKTMEILTGCKIIVGIVTFLIIFVSAFLLTDRFEMIVAIILIGIATVLDSFTIFFRSVFRSRERMEYESLSFIFEGIFKFLFLIAAVEFFKAELIFLIAALLVTSIVTLIFTIIICKKKAILALPIFEPRLYLDLIRKGTPFAIAGFLVIANFKIDIVMLPKLTNDSATGWYSAAVKLIEPILIIPFMLAIVLFPILTKLYKSSLKDFISFCRILPFNCVMFSIPFALLLYFSSDFLISYIFGQEFIKSVLVVKILSPILVIFFLKFFLERVALVLKKFFVLFIAYSAGVVLKVILNLILIPIYSYQGAAYGTLFSEFFIVIYMFMHIRSNLRSLSKKPFHIDLLNNAPLFYEER